MLNKEQKDEVRQMFSDLTGKQYEEIKGMLNTMSVNLMRIEGIGQRTEEHAKLTNGRVTKLEAEVISLKLENVAHNNHCPNVTRIKALEDAEIERKAVKAFSWKQLIIASAIIGFIIAIAEIIF